MNNYYSTDQGKEQAKRHSQFMKEYYNGLDARRNKAKTSNWFVKATSPEGEEIIYISSKEPNLFFVYVIFSFFQRNRSFFLKNGLQRASFFSRLTVKHVKQHLLWLMFLKATKLLPRPKVLSATLILLSMKAFLMLLSKIISLLMSTLSDMLHPLSQKL